MKEKKYFNMIAKTISGLETVLEKELQNIGASDIKPINRAVAFVGDTTVLYKANYLLRTALRILKPIAHFEAANNDVFYQEVYKIPWEKYFDVNRTISVDAVVSESFVTHSKYIALKAKDAIVDRYRDKKGNRPNVELNQPDIKINVHLYKNQVTVSLDSSGDSLHKRGYKKISGEAPLSEVLAAGIILHTNWDTTVDFYDTMCGSGTLVTEAAMIACNIPAGFFRDSYCFMQWNDFDRNIFEKIISEEKKKISEAKSVIYAYDINKQAIIATRKNIQSLNPSAKIIIQQADMFQSPAPKSKGILIINPPYDERIKTDDIIGLYKKIGDVFKQRYQGFKTWVISGDTTAIKHIGLKPFKKIDLFNGPLPCKLYGFDIFDGTYKDMKANQK